MGKVRFALLILFILAMSSSSYAAADVDFSVRYIQPAAQPPEPQQPPPKVEFHNWAGQWGSYFGFCETSFEHSSPSSASCPFTLHGCGDLEMTTTTYGDRYIVNYASCACTVPYNGDYETCVRTSNPGCECRITANVLDTCYNSISPILTSTF